MGYICVSLANSYCCCGEGCCLHVKGPSSIFYAEVLKNLLSIGSTDLLSVIALTNTTLGGSLFCFICCSPVDVNRTNFLFLGF